MSIELQSMQDVCGKNHIASLVSIEYALPEWLLTFPEFVAPGNQYTNPVTFNLGFDWLKAKFVHGTAQYNLLNRNNEDGDVMPIKIKAEFPFDSTDASELFQKMLKLRYILRIRDVNNNTYLIGTPEFPIRFRYTRESGKIAGDFAGFKYEFYGDSLIIPPFYNP